MAKTSTTRAQVDMSVSFSQFMDHLKQLALRTGYVDDTGMKLWSWHLHTSVSRMATELAAYLFTKKEDDELLRDYLVALRVEGYVTWRVPGG